jgi:GNAT superfamily N-acetyltransferase
MHSRCHHGLTIRPLRNGDVATVGALLDRLGPRSRARRFGGAKPRLSDAELETMARVDGTHHALVAYLGNDPRPAGLAQLVRDGEAAEIACAVADDVQARGIGSALLQQLAADARAAGIVRLEATVQGDNPPAVSLLTRCAATLDVRWRGGERAFVLAL